MKKHVLFLTLTGLLAIFAFGTTPAAPADDSVVPMEWQKANYPLDTCVVGKGKLGDMGPAYEHIHEGRLVQFCCGDCKGKFTADPETYLAELDKAAIARQTKDYSTTTCPVSGEILGSDGEPFDRVFQGRLVRLCCKGCTKKFDANPAAYIKKLDAQKAGSKTMDSDKGGHDHSKHAH